MSSANKIVKSKTPGEAIAHQVRFTPERFDELVFDKGYDIYHDKALQCPCSVKNSGNALPNCNNCLGMGWIFINRTETRIAVQGMKVDVRFENWSKENTGMAKITSRAIDKLAFMDRLVLKDVEGYFNEILRSKVFDSENVIVTLYDIIEIESLYLFISPKEKLKELKQGTDFTIQNEFGTVIVLSPDLSITEDSTFTIRYRHLQTYHIIDMNRDIVKVRTKGCKQPDEQLKAMPIMGMARKAHYLFDNIKYDDQQRLIENSTE